MSQTNNEFSEPKEPRRRPFGFSDLSAAPVTTGICLAAIGVTWLWHWQNFDIRPLTMSVRFWRDEFWTPVTTIFPHVGILHLAFNLMWTWPMGSRVERLYGPVRLLLMVAFLAIFSSCAEFAVHRGGVGLSGVVYGLFGYFYVLRHERQEFAEIAHPGNVQLMVGWFFLCIALTWMDVMPVANVAHGMGAVGGLALGWIVKASGSRRQMRIAGLGLGTVAILLMASIFRPYVNVASETGFDHIWLGHEALVAGNEASAEENFEKALKVNPSDGQALYFMAVLRHKQKRFKEAADFFMQAWKQNAPFPETKQLAFDMANFVAEHAALKEDRAEADRYHQMALSVEPNDKETLQRHGAVLMQLGRTAEAKRAMEKSRK